MERRSRNRPCRLSPQNLLRVPKTPGAAASGVCAQSRERKHESVNSQMIAQQRIRRGLLNHNRAQRPAPKMYGRVQAGLRRVAMTAIRKFACVNLILIVQTQKLHHRQQTSSAHPALKMNGHVQIGLRRVAMTAIRKLACVNLILIVRLQKIYRRQQTSCAHLAPKMNGRVQTGNRSAATKITPNIARAA